MLKTYQAIYEKGQIQWIGETPEVESAHVLITILEEVSQQKKKRTRPAHLIGQIKILGDIVSPIVPEEDWECLK
ncbi:MAG: hypothetical protein HC924_19680 [Synechococcaceae cyanobacterium SM2_3_2]|nr:hypothetical protein [Synechococcaceae cyanobacterium SM2_3_2]